MSPEGWMCGRGRSGSVTGGGGARSCSSQSATAGILCGGSVGILSLGFIDLLLWGQIFYNLVVVRVLTLCDRHGQCLSFVEITLHERTNTNAFMNEDLRAHWNAFRITDRVFRGKVVWEPKPPPSIEFPPSLAVHFIDA